jgi:hypothetical protein
MNSVRQKKNAAKILAAVFGVLFALSPGYNGGKTKKSAEALTGDFLTITASEDKLGFYGSAGGTGNAYIVRFNVRQYHSSTAFLSVPDPINTSLKYYDTAAAGTVEATVALPAFETQIERYTPDGYDKAYDKFYVITGGTVSGGQIAGGTVQIGPKYATEFVSRQNYRRKALSSIKGLEVMIVDDGEDLGIKHTNHVYDINSILSSASDASAIPYTSNGKAYYFNRAEVLKNDKAVKEFTDAGMETTFVLLMWAYNGNINRSKLVHPEFDYDERVDTLCMAAPNMVEDEGVGLFQAVCEFLAERYTREDGLYGRAATWVIGNEIDTSMVWNNMGQVPLDEYIRQYDRGMRIAYTAIKKHWANANVMPPLTQSWNRDFTVLFGVGSNIYNKWHNKGSFTSKDTLTALNALTKAEGDYDWKVAFHPYGLDMRENTFWDQTNVQGTNQGADSPYLTPLNIEELPRFLSRPEMTYKGKMRDFYFTEQGFSSKPTGVSSWDAYNWATDYDPETTFSEERLMEQAAMYAFAYYKFKFIGASANIHHRHFDYGPEQAALGVLFREKGTSRDIYGKKPVWEVMKYIDTERSLEFTLPLLKYIKIWAPGGAAAAKSWEELIPGDPAIPGYEKFDSAKLADSPLVQTAELTERESVPGGYRHTGFEDGETGGWVTADHATSFSVVTMPDYAAAGDRLAIMRYSNDKWVGGGTAYKGIQKIFDEPIDASGFDSFTFAVNVTPLAGGAAVKHSVKVRFYSGDSVYESAAEITQGRWYFLSVSLKNSGWSGLGAVDKIKIWYNTNSNDISSGGIYFDEIGFYKEGETGGGQTAGQNGCQNCGAANTGAALAVLALAGIALGVRRFF